MRKLLENKERFKKLSKKFVITLFNVLNATYSRDFDYMIDELVDILFDEFIGMKNERMGE